MRYLDYHEKKNRGTLEFPVEIYHITHSHPRYEMSYHWHIECELIYIIKGTLHLTIDHEKLIATEGDILYLHGGVLHGGIPTDCIYDCLVFDISYLLSNTKLYHNELYEFINHTLLVQSYFPAKPHPLIHQLIHSLFDCVSMKHYGYELIGTGYLFQFYGYILEQHLFTQVGELSKQNTKRILQLKKALEIIETSYHTPITLNQLANAADMNAKYFCRFFHEMTEKTPIEYLNYYRIEMASFQLITTNESITNVALNCGFNDISYFIKTFKKYKGTTPKKFMNTPI